MRKLFGTDGVRGVANVEPMTAETALRLGRAAAYIFRRGHKRHRIVIGKDTRISGYMLESALVAGICSMGVDVLLVGPMPTPAIAFITRSLRADAGVVISASHNPYEDNGIKFFSSDGFKLPDKVEAEMEQLLTNGEIDEIRPTATEIGKAYRIDDAEGRYIEFLKNSFPRGMDLEGIKIVLDCANGAAYKVTPKVLTELGAEVFVFHNRPNGENINLDCGSLHPEVVQKAVLEHKANLGISLDGDADRAILVDEQGKIIDGDHIMAICALDFARRGKLEKNTLVTTVMSNLGLDIALKKSGIKVVKTGVGDRYVMEEMRKEGYILGGEQSGHIIFLNNSTSGDGSLTSLQTLAIMAKTRQPLSQLADCMHTLPQILLNKNVKEKKDLSRIPHVQETIRKVETRLGENGRVLVRYSGTQAMVRIMVEGEDKQQIKQFAEEIVTAITDSIGFA